MSKSQYEKVREFQIAFNCPAPENPTVLTDKQAMQRATWIMEEVLELLYATAGSEDRFYEFYKTLFFNMEDTYKKQFQKEFPENVLVAQADAFTDINYFGTGGFAELGIDPEPLFKIVHLANMNKIWEDGLPHYNEFGKIIKPPNWVAPEPFLEAEIKRQINNV